MRNVLNVIVLALCLIGSACSKSTPTAPVVVTPTVSVAPQTLQVGNGGTTNLTVSDPDAVCKATAGTVKQSGVTVQYITPGDVSPYGYGGLVEVRCDKPGVQPGVAHVTVTRLAVIEYSRPDGFAVKRPDIDNVIIRMYFQTQFGWSEQSCPTTLVQTTPKKIWRCVRDFVPGTYYTAVGDNVERSGSVADNVFVWGTLVKGFTSIPGLTGTAVKFEITSDYNVR